MNSVVKNIKENIKKVIIGKDDIIDLVLTGILAGGHVLIEDAPGTGKTQLSKAVAKSIGADFKRISFTPDLLPSDVCGINYFDKKSSDFKFKEGAVFTNILLADEINRATPRTQSSLLECMEERQVSVDGKTYKLDEPFFVIATQNPIETAGTFPLPEAQLDRFMLKISVGYPNSEDEMRIINTYINDSPDKKLGAVCSAEELCNVSQKAKEVFVSDAVKKYIIDITAKTREDIRCEMPISTRGVLAMLSACRAYAFVCGRDFVTADDVRYLAGFVFAHRVKSSTDAENGEIIEQILSGVSAPTEEWNKR